jgi:lathosterol oxidase
MDICVATLFSDISNTLSQAMMAWPMIFLGDFLRYVIPASIMAGILALFQQKLAGRKLQTRSPKPGQVRREILFSISSVVIFSLNGAVILAGKMLGVFEIYDAIEPHGWIYLIASTVLVIVAHDAYFYWTHRLIHHPKLFSWAHRTHHRSRTPTPWAAYAFDPAEALLNGIFLTLFLLVVPLHGIAVLIFLTHMIIRNVIGHAGYEIFPKAMQHHPVWGQITNVRHHDQHHRDMLGNYGLYFTWWDRLMGTENSQSAKLKLAVA